MHIFLGKVHNCSSKAEVFTQACPFTLIILKVVTWSAHASLSRHDIALLSTD